MLTNVADGQLLVFFLGGGECMASEHHTCNSQSKMRMSFYTHTQNTFQGLKLKRDAPSCHQPVQIQPIQYTHTVLCFATILNDICFLCSCGRDGEKCRVFFAKMCTSEPCTNTVYEWGEAVSKNRSTFSHLFSLASSLYGNTLLR